MRVVILTLVQAVVSIPAFKQTVTTTYFTNRHTNTHTHTEKQKQKRERCREKDCSIRNSATGHFKIIVSCKLNKLLDLL